MGASGVKRVKDKVFVVQVHQCTSHWRAGPCRALKAHVEFGLMLVLNMDNLNQHPNFIL